MPKNSRKALYKMPQELCLGVPEINIPQKTGKPKTE